MTFKVTVKYVGDGGTTAEAILAGGLEEGPARSAAAVAARDGVFVPNVDLGSAEKGRAYPASRVVFAKVESE